MSTFTRGTATSVAIGIAVALSAAMLLGALAVPATAQSTEGGAISSVTAEVTDTAFWTDDAQEIAFSYEAADGAEVTFEAAGESETVMSTGSGKVVVDVGGWLSGASYPVDVTVTSGDQTCTATINGPQDSVVVCEPDDGTSENVTFTSAPTAEVTSEALWQGPKKVTIDYAAPEGTPVTVGAADEAVSRVSEGDESVTLKVGSWFLGAGYPLNVTANTPDQACTAILTKGAGQVPFSCEGDTSGGGSGDQQFDAAVSDGFMEIGQGADADRFNFTECPQGEPVNASETCARVSGVIDSENNTYSVASEDVQFPELVVEDTAVGDVPVYLQAPNGLTGTLDEETGEVTLNGDIYVDLSALSSGCGFTVSISATSGTSGSMTGSELVRNGDTATATVVDNEYSVPGPKNCGLVGGQIENEIGIPSPSGENKLELAMYLEYGSSDSNQTEPAPANFDVSNVDATSPVTAGDAVDVTADVTNTGDQEATQTVELSAGGSVRASEQVTLAGGESQTVTLTWQTASGDAGDYTATVSSDDDSASTALTVEPVLESVDLTLGSSSLVTGDSTTATVTASYSDGSTTDVTSDAALSSSDAGVASVSGSTVTAAGAGSATVSAEFEGVSDSVDVSVDPALQSVSLSIADTDLYVGNTTSASVTAEYSDGSTADVTSSATISSSDTAVATVSGSTVTGAGAGSATISADYSDSTGSASDSVAVSVQAVDPGTNVTLEGISLSVPKTTLAPEETMQATVTAEYSDGSTKDVTDQAQYAAQYTSNVTVAGNQVIAVSEGQSEIGAFYEEDGVQATDRVLITVETTEPTGPNLTSVDLTLGSTSFSQVGDTTTATVVANYDDGSTADVTSEATLSSSDASVASVSGSTVTAEADGSATITADYSDSTGSASDSVDVSVSTGSSTPQYSSFTVYGADGALQLGSGAEGGNEKDRFNLTECPGGQPTNESLDQSDCIQANGTIDVDAGTFSVPASEVSFPPLQTYSAQLGQNVDVYISAPNGMSGNVDYESGFMNLKGTLRVRVQPDQFGENCGFNVPFNATTGTSYNESGNIGSYTGEPLTLNEQRDTANVTQVDATFAVPGATDCGLFNSAVNNEVDLPSPSGENVAELSWYIEFAE